MLSFSSKVLNNFIYLVENELLAKVSMKSINPHDPIDVEYFPSPWIFLGAGNYAAAFYHPDYSDLVVKIYAEGRPGIEEEIEVYRILGEHPAYSMCFYHGTNYLILKRLMGITLYDSIKKGIQIPPKIIKDIDEALDYARERGLHPHDVHFKNVMMHDGQGMVADVSDFLHDEYCLLWEHSKKAYYKLYLPYLYKCHPPIPDFLLNIVRKCYQIYKKFKKIN